VAFSRHAQPLWFRVLKYVVLGCFIYFFWKSAFFWWVLAIVLILGLLLHLWYRHKTEAWTKSFGGWDYEKNESRLEP
jgi:hypothetical protein